MCPAAATSGSTPHRASCRTPPSHQAVGGHRVAADGDRGQRGRLGRRRERAVARLRRRRSDRRPRRRHSSAHAADASSFGERAIAVPTTHEMIYNVPGVVSYAVDEAGVAPMLEVLTHDVQTRCRSDTSLLADRAVRRQHRHVQPAVVWAVAGRDDHRPDVLAGKAQPRHRCRRHRTGLVETAGRTSRFRPALSM